MAKSLYISIAKKKFNNLMFGNSDPVNRYLHVKSEKFSRHVSFPPALIGFESNFLISCFVIIQFHLYICLLATPQTLSIKYVKTIATESLSLPDQRL